MKLVTCATAAVLALAFAASTLAQKSDSDNPKKSSKVVTKFDKSKNQTSVRTKEFRITALILEKQARNTVPLHQVDASLQANYSGQTPGTMVGDVMLTFHITSSNYTFLKSQTIIAALDNADGNGKALMLGPAEYKSTAPKFNTVYEEFLTVNITPEAVSKMAAARSLDFYLGPLQYRVAPESLTVISDFYNSIKPPTTASK